MYVYYKKNQLKAKLMGSGESKEKEKISSLGIAIKFLEAIETKRNISIDDLTKKYGLLQKNSSPAELETFKNKFRNIQKRIQDDPALKQQSSLANDELKEKTQQVKHLTQKLNEKIYQLDQLQYLNKYNQQKNLKLIQEKSVVEKKLTQANSKAQKQRRQMNQKLESLESKLSKTEEDCNQKIKQLQANNQEGFKKEGQKLSFLEQKNHQLIESIKNKNLENQKKLNDEIKSLNDDLREKEIALQLKSKNIEDIGNQLKAEIQKKQKLQKQNIGLRDELANKEKQLTKLAEREKQNLDQLKDYEEKNNQNQKIIIQLSKQTQNYSPKNFFLIAEIFEKPDKRISHLMEEIQKLKNGKEITKTKLVYHQDPKNKTSFHAYIDQIPNILILIELSTAEIIGCFSEKPLQNNASEQQQYGNLGILFNLNRNKFYQLSDSKEGPIPRVFMYDDYYLVIGNSEIRFVPNQAVAKSNFGLKGKFFDNKNETVKDFVGSEDRELQIKNFEVHQIILEE